MGDHQIMILGDLDTFKMALQQDDNKRAHVKKVMSQFWLYSSELAHNLGVDVVPQGRN